MPAGPNGQRQQIGKGGFDTAKDAASARAELLAKHQQGTLPVDRSLTVGQFLRRWLAARVDLHGDDPLRRSTEVSYQAHITLYLTPHLGHIKLAELRPSHITDMFTRIRTEREAVRAAVIARNDEAAARVREYNDQHSGQRPRRAVLVGVPRTFGPATAARVRATLSSALSSAQEENLVARNVAAVTRNRKGRARKAQRPKVKVWQPETLGQFLDALEGAGDRLYPLVHVAAFAGLRRGELVGLKWTAVDLDARTVTVDWQHATAGYEVVEGEPKTDESNATIDIDAATVRTLRKWRAVQAAERLKWGPAYVDSGLVFTREDGSAFHPDYITKRFVRLVARHGLPRTRLHDLRHLAASLQLAAGVDIAIVSKRLRHSSIGITNDTYSHLIGTVGRDAAEKASAQVPRRAAGSGA